MSSDKSNSVDSPSTSGRRRSSFVDLFGPRPPSSTQTSGPRRLSITTLGLSTMPGAQTSPYNTMRARAESVSSANSGSVDESPFEDEPSGAPASMSSSVSSSMPATPFARRMSFGAKALRDPRNGGSSSPNISVAPTGTANEGFDFAENLRARAERTSVSGASFVMPQPANQTLSHNRSKSITAVEPPREHPKQPRAPDAFQERILKGDFYMD